MAITAEELKAFVEGYERSEYFEEITKFIGAWFCPEVASIEMHTDNEYDDEGGYRKSISRTYFFDENGKRLCLDEPTSYDYDEWRYRCEEAFLFFCKGPGRVFFLDLQNPPPKVDLEHYNLTYVGP